MPRKSVLRLTDRLDMTLDVYRGRKTTMEQQQQSMCMADSYLKGGKKTEQNAVFIVEFPTRKNGYVGYSYPER